MRQQAVNFGTRIVTDDIVSPTRPRPHHDRPRSVLRAHAVNATASKLPGPAERGLLQNNGVPACRLRYRPRQVACVASGKYAAEEVDHRLAAAPFISLPRHAAGEQAMARGPWESEDHDEMEKRSSTRCVRERRRRRHRAKLTGTTAAAKPSIVAASLAIGHTPNTDFLKGKIDLDPWATRSGRSRLWTYTSVEGIFAAGDVADAIYRRPSPRPAAGAWRADAAAGWRRRH